MLFAFPNPDGCPMWKSLMYPAPKGPIKKFLPVLHLLQRHARRHTDLLVLECLKSMGRMQWKQWENKGWIPETGIFRWSCPAVRLCRCLFRHWDLARCGFSNPEHFPNRSSKGLRFGRLEPCNLSGWGKDWHFQNRPGMELNFRFENTGCWVS